MFFFKKNKFIFFVLDQLEFLLQTAGPKLKIKSHIQVFKKVKKWKPLRKGCSKVSFFDIFSVLGPYTRAKSCFSEKIFSVLRRNAATFCLFFAKNSLFSKNWNFLDRFEHLRRRAVFQFLKKQWFRDIFGKFWEFTLNRRYTQKGWFLGGVLSVIHICTSWLFGCTS